MSPRLAKYELLEEIGHGGMATVYRARDRRLGREVAVKIIHRHLRENREVAQRFQSEARAVAKLRHPSIVEVYDVSDSQEDERYLVAELVRGTTLRQLLSDEGSLPPEVGAAIGVELAEALDHAHGLGVIHRDVKPENVLVSNLDVTSDTSLIKITDFGIAKLLDAQGVTSTGQVLGSPAHMAPEQIEGGEVSARADVFGLGVLIYECMVGRLPFDGKNPAQVLRRVLDGTFTPADRARPTIGSEFSEVLSCALAHDAQDRYSSAAELAKALRAELVALGIESPSREIRAFLADPAGYRLEHEPRIVARLVERARVARENRDVPTAAACYNRALAYRPDDSALLASVLSLTRGTRIRRLAERSAVTLLAILAVAGAVVALVRSERRTSAEGSMSARPPAPNVSPAAGPSVRAAAVAPGPSASALPERAASSVEVPAHKPVRNAARAQPEPEGTERNARVQILVDGPQNAIVRVDGTETAWFGNIQDLKAGDHVFEFMAPDEQCCLPGKPLNLRLRPSSSPEDVQTVRGRIEFRPAILDLRGPVGSTASCGTLGEFAVPSQQQIPMAVPRRTVSCQLLPPAGSTEAPIKFDVTLRPGRLSTNLGQ